MGSDGGWASFCKTAPSVGNSKEFGELLRFTGGGFVPALATFGLLVAALPGLFFGRDWRFHLSVRLWFATVISVFLTWLGARGWLGAVEFDPHMFGPPPPHLR